MSGCLRVPHLLRILHMEGYQQNPAELEPLNVESPFEGVSYRDWRAALESRWNDARPDTFEVFPMPDLPYDVLGEIFEQVALDSDNPYALIHTASVCSSWRSVTFSHPQLWGYIHLYGRYTGRFHYQEHLLDLYLQRSNDCGLSITMDFAFRRPRPAILARLRSQAHRWVEVFISYLPPSDIFDLLAPLPSDVSLERLCTLTGLSLNMLDFQFYNIQRSRERFPMDILSTASCLRTLHAEIFEPDLFVNAPKRWDMPEGHILSSVRDLVVVPGRQPPSRASEMPPKCWATAVSPGPASCDFPVLTLCVSGYSSKHAITDAVHDLTLPLLRHLFIVYIGIRGRYAVKPGPLVPLIEHCSNSIETFVLDKVPMATRHVLGLLSPLHHLHSLTIHEIDPLSSTTRRGFPINHQLFEELLRDSFLPSLISIDLDWHSSENASMYELLLTQVVQSRGLQRIGQSTHIGRRGWWYSFGNDFVPYFETLPMDLLEEESDPEELPPDEVATELLRTGIEAWINFD
ncbi:uncharacterized protein ARMOST_15251 [Armillaria ostoyae]|uniref:F-box domain-containing protein n=1 Tax=Armillaria ostoyae TaxID=47428 RepID=A0A284RSX3_ARMOS|nr:uncharacterized protein ARMOST_15251 [Armillaria ostoyae]